MSGREKRSLPTVGDGRLHAEDDRFYREEVFSASRNSALPLEALEKPITPAGMHYVLHHYDVPQPDPAAWRLEVGGLVEKPLSLSLDALRGMPAAAYAAVFECAGNGRAHMAPRRLSQPWFHGGVGCAEWRGVRLRAVLEAAGVKAGAPEILFTGLDEGVQGGERQFYQRSLPVKEAMGEASLLAWEMNGQPLPAAHGAPLRLVVPGWYGMANVKWLGRIEAIGEPFHGYQMDVAYVASKSADAPGARITLMKPRALMAPPGIPVYMSAGGRICDAGEVHIEGKAWSGRARIIRVEVSTDGGASWQAAGLGAARSPHAWAPWFFKWNAAPGRHTLICRATDETGEMQPLDPEWNVEGMINNAVQRVEVEVKSSK
ncbi:MAG: sulfite oxidase [bacterium]|nr:sulfite oxidase [bacterium]